ncbi:hypothetical protein ELL70_06235 [Escherichia coli]|nr:hypothetical protein [Escherichia coli]
MVDSQKKILPVSILTFIATFQFNVNTVNVKRAFHLSPPKKNNMNLSKKTNLMSIYKNSYNTFMLSKFIICLMGKI